MDIYPSSRCHSDVVFRKVDVSMFRKKGREQVLQGWATLNELVSITGPDNEGTSFYET
jgi:hypothetical protein